MARVFCPGLHAAGAAGPSFSQVLIDRFGQLRVDAGHPTELFDARGAYALESAEVIQKTLAAARTHAGNLLQRRLGCLVLPATPVSVHRKTMRFVADALV